METSQQEYSLGDLIKNLKVQRDWVMELSQLSILISRLEQLNKVTSCRELAKLINKSKSWVGVSLILITGLKLYPEIAKFRNRNKAYHYLQKKNKLRRFLES